MTAAYNEARDQIFALFKTAWDANTAALTPGAYVPEVRWQGKEVGTKPPSDKHWARISTQSVLETQATLSDCVEEPGKSRYESSGLVFVQVFSPKSQATAYEVGQQLAIVARNAFRGKKTSGQVWFRNVRINNLDPENLFYRFNVVAEYEYDEVG